MKICSKCLVEKPETQFYRRSGRVETKCKSCMRARSAAWRKANPNYTREYSRSYYAARRPVIAAEGLRTCATCNRELLTTDFYKSWCGDGLRKECKSCVNAKQKSYVQANRHVSRAAHKRWRCANKDAWREIYTRAQEKQKKSIGYQARRKKSMERTRAKHGDTYKQRARENINSLADTYVKQRIKQKIGAHGFDVPQAFIEAQRLHLKLKRLLQEKQREPKQTDPKP